MLSSRSNVKNNAFAIRCWLVTLSLVTFSSCVFAQNHVLNGKIVDEKGEAIPGITILNPDSKLGTITNGQGTFLLKDLDSNCTINLSGVGYIPQSFTVDFKGRLKKDLGTLTMKESSTTMKEVVVTGSRTEFVSQKAYSVAAIDIKPLQVQNLDVNQVLNKVTGVRIRETGGLGSRFNFSLNGLSGNQIKFFIDDIPMDVMGRAYSLNNFPVNLIEQVEVYKGVVPVQLGSDALGGAVNIVSNNGYNQYLNASYSFGSFNTHRTAIVGKYRFENGFTVSLKGFHNYSDNDYTMYGVEGYVNRNPIAVDAKRFHDAYESKMTQTEIGFTDKKWADRLLIGAAYANLSNEIQTGFSINPPFGDVTEHEDDYIINLDYRKDNFMVENLDFKYYALYSRYDRTVIDTSSFIYDWSGGREVNINPTWGEALRKKSFFEFSQTSTLNRAYLNYDVTPNQNLTFNYITTRIERQGENRFEVPEEQPFISPNSINKHIFGLAHEMNLLGQDLSVIGTLKYYFFNINARDVLTTLDNELVFETLNTSLSEPGYSLALRHYFNDRFFIKTSFEKGFRIPEAVELFGDGLAILSNPYLLPEASYNLNLGGQYSLELDSENTLRVEVNAFNRDIRDFIFERNTGKVNQFQNVLNVRSRGVETELRYQFKERLGMNANLTWQEFTNNEEISRLTGRSNPAYGLRMPNTPFLFGNFDVNYTFNPLLDKVGLSTYYSMNYVNEFLLNYDIISGPQNEIPTQIVHNMGVTFSDSKQTHSFSLEARNMFNELAFDNFKLQKPGRAFYLKWNYFLM
ncbi:MAG: TonB-dependent receptor plug domain-containing protein [Bacteroidota bacterium]